MNNHSITSRRQPLPITDDNRVSHFDNVFIDWIGGDDVWNMLIDYHKGMSYRDVAEAHGTDRMTAHRWITTAKMKMRRAGLDADAITPPEPAR